MRIIKNNRKVFVGVIIGAALIAIIPTILVYMLSKMSIGIEVGDSMEVVEEKINTYFEDGGFEKDIENALRKKPSGDFSRKPSPGLVPLSHMCTPWSPLHGG